MMDIKAVACVVLIIVSIGCLVNGDERVVRLNKRSPSMDNERIDREIRNKRSPSMDTERIDREIRNKRSPNRNPANDLSSASPFGGGTSGAVSSSASGNANAFAGASASSLPGFGTEQSSWAGNSNPDNFPTSAIGAVQPPSTSWMIPPRQTPDYRSQQPAQGSPIPSGQARPGYTPIIGLSGTFDLNDPAPGYQQASANCDLYNCNVNYNPPRQSSNPNPQNFPNYYPSRTSSNNYPAPPTYFNRMPYNPRAQPQPSYGNPAAGHGGYASAGSFASGGGVGGDQQPARYPGFNEISVNSRFGPVEGWPGDDDPFKWVQDQNRAIQAKFQAQFDHFRKLNNQQSHWGSDDGTAWAWGSSSAGPNGGSQAGAIGPVAPGIESRFAEDVPSSGGGGSYSSFTSSSSSSTVDENGKVHTTKEVTTGVNDNGKVSIKTIKDP